MQYIEMLLSWELHVYLLRDPRGATMCLMKAQSSLPAKLS